MSVLQDFLAENADLINEEQEVVVSKRFKDKNGNLIKFKVKPVNGEQFTQYQKECTKIEIIGRKQKSTFDSSKFNLTLVKNHCVDPDFKNADFLKKLNVLTPEQAIAKTLLAGEVITLGEKISAISGFDNDINEEIEEAKN